MKRYILLIFIMLMTSAAFAQSNYEDVVYLKNGSIIRGIITEQIPNETIKIEISNGSVFVYRMDEIERIAREPIQGRSRDRDTARSDVDFESGYEVSVELGYQIGTGDVGLDRLKMDIVNGYRINPYIFIGMGTGWRYYHDPELALVPLFLNFKVNFIQTEMSPFVALSTGYSLNASSNFKGAGAFIAPTVGVDFPISYSTKMYVGLSYESQRLKENFSFRVSDDIIWEEEVSYSYNAGALSLSVGFTF